MSNWKIPLSDLDFGPEETDAVVQVLQRRWLSMGPEVAAFEAEFAAMQGSQYALAISNATAGLHLALLALGIGPGDEVIQPAINFVASANMTVATGATPVFADIVSLNEPTIDPVATENLITSKTRAIVVMHYGGNFARLSDFRRICDTRGIHLIEDACHAVGATYAHPNCASSKAGSVGTIGAFSFFANKNLATGEGGMLVTDSKKIYERFRLLRSHGMTSVTWDRHRGHASSYEVPVHGYNYRLDEIHAAIGRVQLRRLLSNNRRRCALIQRYRDLLAATPTWTVPFAGSSGESAGHLMVAVADSPATRTRATEALRQAGIQTSLHYPCIADFAAFSNAKCDSLTLSRQFTSRAITLPLYPTLAESDVEFIATILAGVTTE